MTTIHAIRVYDGHNHPNEVIPSNLRASIILIHQKLDQPIHNKGTRHLSRVHASRHQNVPLILEYLRSTVLRKRLLNRRFHPRREVPHRRNSHQIHHPVLHAIRQHIVPEIYFIPVVLLLQLLKQILNKNYIELIQAT